MKQWLVTLGLALGALALFYALFLPKPAPAGVAAAPPTSVEAGDSGYQAAWRWLTQSGIPVRSYRQKYDRLGGATARPTGNVLLVTLPLQTATAATELASLRRWVARGNTLLVMAALADTPRWALFSGSDNARFLQDVASLAVKSVAEPGGATSAAKTRAFSRGFAKLLQPTRSLLEPNGVHPLLAGVHAIATSSDYPADRWTVATTDAAPLLAIARHRAAGSAGHDDAALFLKRAAAGQVIFCSYSTPFSNQLIGAQDNARLLANIVDWSRGEGGAVLFDDAHQGLVGYYDAKAFFADARLHRTLLWLLFLWLVFVLGWQRMPRQYESWQPMDVTTFIRATGGFIAGSVAEPVAGERLIQNFFDVLGRRQLRPEHGQPDWDWLRAQAGIESADVQRLQRLHQQAARRRRVDLVALQNLLNRMVSKLA
ncbi:MAG TPA: DUF4350 domain-containing protein [Steroidobacteraceae bacterium]|nr:DUF4350 domain-containing protein [Steroidobacteraceae bacterium]